MTVQMTSHSTTTRSTHDSPHPGHVVDVRDRPLEDLRRAYDERWHLVADDAPDHPTADGLARNATEIADLERRCRPAGRVLPRRTGPDPSTFLG
jgi:hypothetical protein